MSSKRCFSDCQGSSLANAILLDIPLCVVYAKRQSAERVARHKSLGKYGHSFTCTSTHHFTGVVLIAFCKPFIVVTGTDSPQSVSLEK